MLLPAHTEVVFQDTDGLFALFRRNVLVQVRRGQLTASAVTRVREMLRPSVTTGRAMGMLLIVEPGAQVPQDRARQAQRAFIEELAALPSVRMAPVNLGTDLHATMNRSVGRLVAATSPHIRRFDAIEPAITWLVAELSGLGMSVPAKDLASAVEQLRGLVAPVHPQE